MANLCRSHTRPQHSHSGDIVLFVDGARNESNGNDITLPWIFECSSCRSLYRHVEL